MTQQALITRLKAVEKSLENGAASLEADAHTYKEEFGGCSFFDRAQYEKMLQEAREAKDALSDLRELIKETQLRAAPSAPTHEDTIRKLEAQLDICLRYTQGEAEDPALLANDYGGTGWEQHPACKAVGELALRKSSVQAVPDLAKGQVWHVMRPGATACCTLEIVEVTRSTVLFRSPDSYNEERLPISDVRFVELLAAPSAPMRAVPDDAFTEEELDNIQRVLFDNCGPATAKKVRTLLAAAPQPPAEAVIQAAEEQQMAKEK